VIDPGSCLTNTITSSAALSDHVRYYLLLASVLLLLSE
jgi:hypothetical protein